MSYCIFSQLTTATSLMTSFQEFTRAERSIQACWKELIYPATKLELSILCKYDCSDEICFPGKTVLSPYETSFTFTGLVPGSQCDFTLKTIYNQASIDDGIQVPYMILTESKRHMHV